MEHSPETHRTILSCKDHSVSGERFQLLHDEHYDMLVTYPKPSADNLAGYYESDNYISHTDRRKTLMEHLYHFVKQKALRGKRKMLNGICPSKGHILDFGAGTGDFLAEMKKNGWDAQGVEPNAAARAKASSKKIQLIESSDRLPSHHFDLITLWHVLEHVPDVKAQIEELKRLLKADGKIVVAVPNFKSYDAKKYNEFWAAYDVPRHLYHFSQKSIQLLFEEAGLKLVKVLPMKYDAFYVSMLSEKYLTGKISYWRSFLTGLRSNRSAATTGEYSSLIYILQRPK